RRPDSEKAYARLTEGIIERVNFSFLTPSKRSEVRTRRNLFMYGFKKVVFGSLVIGSLLVVGGQAQAAWRDIHQDRRDIHRDFKDIRSDRRDIRADRRDLHNDFKDLRGDRRELRRDYRDVRHDRNDLRADLRD